LNHFQIVYDLHRDGTIDRERYELWEGFAGGIVAPKGIREWWDGESGKLAFMPEVRGLIDRRLEDKVDPPRPIRQMGSVFGARSWEASELEQGAQPLSESPRRSPLNEGLQLTSHGVMQRAVERPDRQAVQNTANTWPAGQRHER
jgi:hypothetical protein